LSLTASGADLSALFTFYLPPGTQKQGYTYSLHGAYDSRTAKFSLVPVRWETDHPSNFVMVGVNGTFESDELSGTITGAGCTTFHVDRDQAESAKIASVMSGQKSVAAPASAPPSPDQDRYAAALRAQAPASARSAYPPAQPRQAPQPAAQSANAQARAKSQAAKKPPNKPATESGGDDYDDEEAKMTNPVLKWKMVVKKDPDSGGSSPHPTARTFLDYDRGDFVDATASCGHNGVSVFFVTDSYGEMKTPAFAFYNDDSNHGELVVDVPTQVDGARSHTAKGFPDDSQDQVYSNTMGILFYDPNLLKQVGREAEFGSRTGTPLDNLVGPMVRQAADADAQAGANDSAGPLTDLMNSQHVQVELSIKDWDGKKPVLDLNPRDPVLHKFVADCGVHFGLKSTTAPTAGASAAKQHSSAAAQRPTKR
jgi:hypothetical protein